MTWWRWVFGRMWPSPAVAEPQPSPDPAPIPPPPPPAPPQLVTAEQIINATHCQPASVNRYWPILLDELADEEILTRNVAIMTAATVAIETAWRFAPVRELYNGPSREAYFEEKYSHLNSIGRQLGNKFPGDGAAFYGRGFIQLTGRENYTYFGRVLSLPLVEQPDLALDPVIAARILARYCNERGVATAADLGDWPAVRRRVNGGLNGWEEFIGVVRRLQIAA